MTAAESTPFWELALLAFAGGACLIAGVALLALAAQTHGLRATFEQIVATGERWSIEADAWRAYVEHRRREPPTPDQGWARLAGTFTLACSGGLFWLVLTLDQPVRVSLAMLALAGMTLTASFVCLAPSAWERWKERHRDQQRSEACLSPAGLLFRGRVVPFRTDGYELQSAVIREQRLLILRVIHRQIAIELTDQTITTEEEHVVPIPRSQQTAALRLADRLNEQAVEARRWRG